MLLNVGVPLHATLGSPCRSLDEIYDRLGVSSFSAEFKYDGQRVQLHTSKAANGDVIVNLFSRHLESMTGKVRFNFLNPIGVSLRLSPSILILSHCFKKFFN